MKQFMTRSLATTAVVAVVSLLAGCQFMAMNKDVPKEYAATLPQEKFCGASNCTHVAGPETIPQKEGQKTCLSFCGSDMSLRTW